MKVRDAASLELQHPQVMHTGEPSPETGQPRIKVTLDSAAVRGGTVVRQTELRYQRDARIAGERAQTTAGLIRESLNFCSLWWGGTRFLYVPGPYNLYRLGVDQKAVRGVALRYGPNNKRRIRRTGTPHHPGGAGAAGLFTAGLTPP